MESDCMKATAWMIKNDGTEISVVTHWYADKGENDELLALAYFLWENDTDSNRIVRDFLDVLSYQMFGRQLKNEHLIFDAIHKGLTAYCTAKPYRIFPKTFAETIACSVLESNPPVWEKAIAPETADGTDLIDILNQRFMRARFGGRYNTVSGCGDMYFRISSVGFNWYPIIRGFVEKYSESIETVTIVRDYESTGCEKYYIDFDSRPYNKMPLTDFLSGQGNTNLLTENSADKNFNIQKVLACGGSVRQLRCQLHMNYGRVQRKLQVLKYREEMRLIE